ncbi:type IV pilin protein [Bdellovibrio svalbardensis]|uniref:Prepilin-type N-terminal cleavage/methylation domain-containing protein n=1 Tax=Bdellovibrio svalbardensis TaxID=2972972 RepID=A0ABT6DPK5_9BACT|nr:prepilin-type N-terminal cleavage/methylation domain-containing protein [Bdellovibrio svalbardensis]MDG0817771.1 prepilin-type N-terminal cleavage/methylation domain-containing protein [Bdellovibrio svalbardensis]
MNQSSRASQRGFSLVELMVVVAIIGVLASIAIPSINRYIAKARQTEAKTNLSTLYTSEKAFFAEYNVYDSRFGAVGYIPEGNLRYNVGFSGVGTQAGIANGYSTIPSVTFVSASAYCLGGAAVMGAGTVGCKMVNGATNAAPPAIADAMCAGAGGVGATCVTGANIFQAGAGARISTNAGVDDFWTIDSNKVVRNTQDGIR